MTLTANKLKLPGALALLLLICFWRPAETRADALVVDPLGDTFGSGSARHDITGVSATYGNSSLTFTVNFAGQVFAPSAANALSVYGFIDIDADRDAATGAAPYINTLGPGPAATIALGDEFVLDLFSEELQAGRVDVLNAVAGSIIGTAPINFGANSFSVTVPLSLLGGSTGLVSYGIIVGTFAELTDRAPNGSVPAQSAAAVPEPTTMLLLGTGLAGVAARLRRRRGGSPGA